MVKEWATVIRWQKGRALLRYGASSGCGSCSARAACGSYALSKIGPNTEHELEIEIQQPLVAGQKVEVGIPEGSLLRSAMLVYLTPLLGLFIFAGLAQFWDLDQVWVALFGIAGGFVGFFIARKLAYHWRDEAAFQPVVLQIGLPPGELLVQTSC
ncbi:MULTISPECIES: SoxR-reducing system protein RseC [Providencia]|uniref:Sigma factor RpoE regulatory protein n=1 Tax=Providencia heimbachae ATCC 35613 TaxID=1354272 RepID=A0A1B7JJG2_9GAMM|nr:MULTISPECIES: SoxR-reducing system protein RseC [Providencia]MBP6122592.1 SoxR-reducing system protein RseC [Providencia sp.]MDD9338562.1 SoxR-reducing system protein RseC [Providencia heimbachae]NIH22204.1 SoxR-reducing system protein RseC [Providencia heimbachae]OAT48058.1 sigma factor RpoE regulatory protein [Providencia heimbachae ATCC 35613]SQH12708.1 Sigma-E factor regulatory protein rseC [Providencia heimbachae]